MRIRSGALIATLASAWSGIVDAAVIRDLPDGVAVAIPMTEQDGFSGPVTFGPITFTSSRPSVFGWTGSYGFRPNVAGWQGVPMIGLDRASGFFELTFFAPVRGFLAEMNWTQFASGSTAAIAAYAADGSLIESLDVEALDGGYYGFGYADNRIARVRFSNEFFGVRNISIAVAAVPEPPAWVMMALGFGLAGVAVRRRNGQPSAANA